MNCRCAYQRIFLIFFLIFVSAEKTLADAPPLPTQKFAKVCSIKQTACVIVDSHRQRTDAYLARKGIIFGRPIWTLTRTSEFSQISDDGKAFVVVESGSCLTGELPSSKTRFVAFYVKGELSATIRAADIFTDDERQKLQSTGSNYQWCSSFGLTDNDRFELNLVTGKKVFFSPLTGLKK